MSRGASVVAVKDRLVEIEEVLRAALGTAVVITVVRRDPETDETSVTCVVVNSEIGIAVEIKVVFNVPDSEVTIVN